MGATPCRVGLVLTLAAVASGDVAEARRRRLELSKQSCSYGSDGYLIELDPSITPDAPHMVECGKKGGCGAFSSYMAAPSEQHAVRCCSDTRKNEWKKSSRCRRRLHGRRLAPFPHPSCLTASSFRLQCLVGDIHGGAQNARNGQVPRSHTIRLRWLHSQRGGGAVRGRGCASLHRRRAQPRLRSGHRL